MIHTVPSVHVVVRKERSGGKGNLASTAVGYRAFAQGPLRYRFDRADDRYLRLEAHDSAGALLGLSNPLWLLPDTDDVKVPGPRKLVLNADKLQ